MPFFIDWLIYPSAVLQQYFFLIIIKYVIQYFNELASLLILDAFISPTYEIYIEYIYAYIKLLLVSPKLSFRSDMTRACSALDTSLCIRHRYTYAFTLLNYNLREELILFHIFIYYIVYISTPLRKTDIK